MEDELMKFFIEPESTWVQERLIAPYGCNVSYLCIVQKKANPVILSFAFWQTLEGGG
jgi:hypothetical protein